VTGFAAIMLHLTACPNTRCSNRWTWPTDALRGRPLYPVAVIGLATGMRRGEIAALRWGDIDLEGGKVRVERSLEQTNAGLAYKAPKTKPAAALPRFHRRLLPKCTRSGAAGKSCASRSASARLTQTTWYSRVQIRAPGLPTA